MSLLSLSIGFLLGALIGWLAWHYQALSPSGGVAAAITGGLIFSLGGIAWAALLLAFFVSSSGLSKAFSRRKAGLSEKYSKGSRRDWGQVLANGGLGALLVVGHGFFPTQSWPWLAYAGAMAAVNADTWATELGVLSPSSPRRITTGRVVERGASGGITLLGTLAALAGGLWIGGIGAFFSTGWGIFFSLGIVPLAGLLGSLFDSWLGATVQVIYRCPVCDKETERFPHHVCGAETIQIRGWRWLNNDWVNFACSALGAGIGVVLGLLLGL